MLTAKSTNVSPQNGGPNPPGAQKMKILQNPTYHTSMQRGSQEQLNDKVSN